MGRRAGRAALPERPRGSGLRRRADVPHHLRPGPGHRPGAQRALPPAQGRRGCAGRPRLRVRVRRLRGRDPAGGGRHSRQPDRRWPCGTRSCTTRCRWWTRSGRWPPRSRPCSPCPAGGSSSTPPSTLLLLAAVTLIRWPLRVSGSEPLLRPNGYTPVRVHGGRRRRAGPGSGGKPGPAGRRPCAFSEPRLWPPTGRRPRRMRRPPIGWRRWPPAEATPRRSGCTGSGARRFAASWPLLDEELEPHDGAGSGSRPRAHAADGGADGDIARRGRSLAAPGPHRHPGARVRRGPAGHPPGAAGPGRCGSGWMPCPTARSAARVTSIAQLPVAARTAGRSIRYGRPSPIPTGSSSRTWRPTRACSPIPPPSSTRILRGPGPLGAAHLVEDLVMRRIALGMVLLGSGCLRGSCRGRE